MIDLLKIVSTKYFIRPKKFVVVWYTTVKLMFDVNLDIKFLTSSIFNLVFARTFLEVWKGEGTTLNRTQLIFFF